MCSSFFCLRKIEEIPITLHIYCIQWCSSEYTQVYRVYPLVFQSAVSIVTSKSLQIQTRETITGIRISSNFIKQPRLEMAKKDIMHIKNTQNNKTKIIQHAAEASDRKYSDVTLFVITDIFISNCDLITHSFLLTVTDYSYIYLVIRLRSFVTCN